MGLFLKNDPDFDRSSFYDGVSHEKKRKQEERCRWEMLIEPQITNLVGNTSCSKKISSIDIVFCPFCGNKIEYIKLKETKE